MFSSKLFDKSYIEDALRSPEMSPPSITPTSQIPLSPSFTLSSTTPSLSPIPFPRVYLPDEECDYLFDILLLGTSSTNTTLFLNSFSSKNALELNDVNTEHIIMSIQIPNGCIAKLHLRGILAQSNFRRTFSTYFTGISGIFFYYDPTDVSTFTELKVIISESSKFIPKDISIRLIGISKEALGKEVVSKKEVQVLAEGLGAKAFSCCSEDKGSLYRVLYEIAFDIWKRVSSRSRHLFSMPRQPPSRYDLSQPTEYQPFQLVEHECETYYLLKLILIGDSSAHKSTLLLTYIDGEQPPDHEIDSIGIDFKNKYMQVPSGDRVRLQIWDTPAGFIRYGKTTETYFKSAHGILLFYNTSKSSSFRFIKKVARYNHEKLSEPGVSVWVVGISSKSSEDQAISREVVQIFADSINADILYCYLDSIDSVNEIFSNVVFDIGKKKSIDFWNEVDSNINDHE